MYRHTFGRTEGETEILRYRHTAVQIYGSRETETEKQTVNQGCSVHGARITVRPHVHEFRLAFAPRFSSGRGARSDRKRARDRGTDRPTTTDRDRHLQSQRLREGDRRALLLSMKKSKGLDKEGKINIFTLLHERGTVSLIVSNERHMASFRSREMARNRGTRDSGY